MQYLAMILFVLLLLAGVGGIVWLLVKHHLDEQEKWRRIERAKARVRREMMR